MEVISRSLAEGKLDYGCMVKMGPGWLGHSRAPLGKNSAKGQKENSILSAGRRGVQGDLASANDHQESCLQGKEQRGTSLREPQIRYLTP